MLVQEVLHEGEDAPVVRGHVDAAGLAEHRRVIGIAADGLQQPDRVDGADLVGIALVEQRERQRRQQQGSQVQ